MNKPTHILVSIDKFHAIKGDDNTAFVDLLFDSPQVDLSEEGMKEKATNTVPNYTDQGKHHWTDGYQQCAKDLLNTKPKEDYPETITYLDAFGNAAPGENDEL